MKGATVGEKFEQWANVELMGHQRVVGRCTEEMIAGHPMLRVDVPDGDGDTFSTRYYGSSAIYCLTVVSEDVARKLCAGLSQAPSFAWDLPRHPKAISAPSAKGWDEEGMLEGGPSV